MTNSFDSWQVESNSSRLDISQFETMVVSTILDSWTFGRITVALTVHEPHSDRKSNLFWNRSMRSSYVRGIVGAPS